jgi:hypothetical protein
MSGGALAASGVIINSTSQIKKSVLTAIAKKARGSTGAKGATGATGAQGAPGTAGTNGTNGTNGLKGEPGLEGPPGISSSLASGQSEHGAWSIQGESERVEHLPAISFPIPLKEALAETAVHFVNERETGPAECEKGTSEHPKAASGNLCIYVTYNEFFAPAPQLTTNPEVIGEATGVGKDGVILGLKAEEGHTSEAQAYGVWDVTQK